MSGVVKEFFPVTEIDAVGRGRKGAVKIFLPGRISVEFRLFFPYQFQKFPHGSCSVYNLLPCNVRRAGVGVWVHHDILEHLNSLKADGPIRMRHGSRLWCLFQRIKKVLGLMDGWINRVAHSYFLNFATLICPAASAGSSSSGSWNKNAALFQPVRLAWVVWICLLLPRRFSTSWAKARGSMGRSNVL